MIFTWIGNGEREHAYVRARAYVRFACLHLSLCADRNTTSTYCVPNQLESCVLLWYSITQFIVMRSNVHLYQFDFSVFRSFLVVINNIWERIQHNRTICSQLFQCLFLLHCFYLVFSCVCVRVEFNFILCPFVVCLAHFSAHLFVFSIGFNSLRLLRLCSSRFGFVSIFVFIAVFFSVVWSVWNWGKRLHFENQSLQWDLRISLSVYSKNLNTISFE